LAGFGDDGPAPGVAGHENPLSSLADDVRAAHRGRDAQEGPVLMAGHSWAAAVITEAGNHPR